MRLYETIPGALAWTTLIAMVLFSWLLPVWVSIFIILFDTYWLLKTVYLSFHLRATFTAMRENMNINWLKKIEALPARESSWRDLYHLIILPMYNEPYEVVRESFQSLVRANYPKDKFIVVLALEERAGEAALATGAKIEREFGNAFHKFLITVHPANLPNEIPGKGSNEAWAGAQARELANQVKQPAPQQWLAAGQPHLGDAQIDKDAYQLEVLVNAQLGILRSHFTGAAINALVIAPVGNGDAQVVNHAPVAVAHAHIAPGGQGRRI